MLRGGFWMLMAFVALLPSSAAAQMERLRPVTDERLANAGDEPENWFVFRRTWDQWGNSPLREITRDNVNQLALAWASGMNAGRNQQEPVVVDGVMFLLHARSEVEALDARSGEPIWRFRDSPPTDTRRSGAQGRSRSLAVYREKVIFGTGDTRVIALEARTGRKVWEVDTLDPGLIRSYYDFSAGPAVGNGKVFLGNACDAAAYPPCYVVALDVETGQVLWKREAIAGDDDSPEAQASWRGVPKEKRLKASFWGTGSYDPKLNLTYWGSASTAPYPEILRGTGDGDVKWTNSTLALEADTGKIAWAFQHLPRDNWDADHVAERTYVDNLRVQPDRNHVKWFNPDVAKGQTRDVLWAIGKPGVLWALDRRTGEFLWAKETVYQEYYRDIDGQGRATLSEEKIPKQVGDKIDICPGMRGGVLWQSRSYSPLTNALYLTVHQTCSSLTIVSTASGLNWTTMTHMPGSDGRTGRLVAIDATSGETLWSYQQRAPLWSVLTTAGGLLFVGDNYRNLLAFDLRTGAKLWTLPLSGPVLGNPITYAVDGRQYLAVTVGGGGAGGPHINNQLTPELQPRTGNNVLMVFALPDRQRTPWPSTDRR